MRRKADKDILKEYRLLIIISIFLILFGIYTIIGPYVIPPVGYDSLQTKEVTITIFEYDSFGRYSGGYHYIRTTDDEKFIISGNYQRKQLRDLLTEGRTVTIKWYKNRLLGTFMAEEIYVNGERVVIYNDDPPDNWKTQLAIGMCPIALGVGGLFLLKYFLKSNRAKQKKRDERIRRKYGNLKK